MEIVNKSDGKFVKWALDRIFGQKMEQASFMENMRAIELDVVIDRGLAEADWAISFHVVWCLPLKAASASVIFEVLFLIFVAFVAFELIQDIATPSASIYGGIQIDFVLAAFANHFHIYQLVKTVVVAPPTVEELRTHVAVNTSLGLAVQALVFNLNHLILNVNQLRRGKISLKVRADSLRIRLFL